MSLVILLAMACSVSPPPEAPPAEAFDETLAGLAEATARHGATVADADDTAAIGAAEDDYWVDCQADWDTMGQCMDSFMDCESMGGMMGAMDDWHGAMDDLWAAMQDHHDTMGACGSVAACHGLESEWQGHMSELFDQMDQMDPGWADDCHW